MGSPTPHDLRPDPHTREAYDARPQPGDHRPPKVKKSEKRARRDHELRRAQAHDDAGGDASPVVLSVKHHGVTYTIDRAAALDVEIFEKVEDGQYVTAIRDWIGREQWLEFKRLHRDPVTGRVPIDALEGLLNKILKATGGAAGNSEASPGS